MTLDEHRGEATMPLTLNRYLYCVNDPVNYMDPGGDFLRNVGSALKRAVGTVVNAGKQLFSSNRNASSTTDRLPRRIDMVACHDSTTVETKPTPPPSSNVQPKPAATQSPAPSTTVKQSPATAKPAQQNSGPSIVNNIVDNAVEAFASPIIGRIISGVGLVAGTVGFIGLVAAAPAVCFGATVAAITIAGASILHSGAKIYTGQSTLREESLNIGLSVVSAAMGVGVLQGGVLKDVFSVYSWGLSNADGLIGILAR